MNVRHFQAPTMNEALREVRKALGEEAVILRTQKVKKGGMLSFMSKELVEVVAASPDHHPVASPSPRPDTAGRFKKSLDAHASVEVIGKLNKEVEKLTGNVQELAEQIKFERMPSLPPNLSEAYKQMIRAGVEEKIVKEIVQQFNIEHKGDELEEKGFVFKELQSEIQRRIKLRQAPLKSRGKVKVFALVGPTGVGKTTTLAKLVTSYRFWGKSNTVLVSADTYRVAAIEQLKTFAAIAGLPMEAVYQPNAMENALSRHRNRDGIFIDTAGRSPLDTDRLEELASFIDAANPDEVLLCLSATTRFEEQLQAISHYSILKPTGIIFTKLDEVHSLGGILNILTYQSLPLTVLTCGQNVPDDIIHPNAGKIAYYILHPDELVDLQKQHFATWVKGENSAKRQETLVGN